MNKSHRSLRFVLTFFFYLLIAIIIIISLFNHWYYFRVFIAHQIFFFNPPLFFYFSFFFFSYVFVWRSEGVKRDIRIENKSRCVLRRLTCSWLITIYIFIVMSTQLFIWWILTSKPFLSSSPPTLKSASTGHMQRQATVNACHCSKRFPVAHVLPTIVTNDIFVNYGLITSLTWHSRELDWLHHWHDIFVNYGLNTPFTWPSRELRLWNHLRKKNTSIMDYKSSIEA